MLYSQAYNFTSNELRERQVKFAALPVGSFEQHGPHLPMTTDTIIATEVARAICEETNGLLLSPITITCSHEHGSFYGNAFISASTLTKVILDIVSSLEHTGINKLILVNAHGGNYVLANIVQELNLEGQRILLLPGKQNWLKAISDAGVQTTMHDDMHAGEIETSILLNLDPALVRSDLIQDELTERPMLLLKGMKAYTKSGTIGAPSLATAEKGKKLIKYLTKECSYDINNYFLS